jgi:hypothetical protein
MNYALCHGVASRTSTSWKTARPIACWRFLCGKVWRDQTVTFLSDGGDTVRRAQIDFGDCGESVLDVVESVQKLGRPQGGPLVLPLAASVSSGVADRSRNGGEQAMRLIIEARLADGDNDTVEEGDGVLAVIERPDCCLAELGLTLAEGRSLLAKVQTELISKQVK